MGLLDRAKKHKGVGINHDEVAKYLSETEEIIDSVAQVLPLKTKTLVLTTDRLLIFTKELLKTSFQDFYFKDIRDVHYSSDLVKQGVISLITDKGKSEATEEIKYLPTSEARDFYVKVQKIERAWSTKKREMELEDKRAASGAANLVISSDAVKPTESNDIEAKLRKLKLLKEKGLIDAATYKRKYDQLIDEL